MDAAHDWNIIENDIGIMQKRLSMMKYSMSQKYVPYIAHLNKEVFINFQTIPCGIFHIILSW